MNSFNMIFKKMQYCGYMALYDKFDYDIHSLEKFRINMENLSKDYNDKKFKIEDFITYATSRKIDAYDITKRFPNKQKIFMLKEYSKMRGNNDMKAFDSAMVIYISMMSLLLGAVYEFTDEEIKQFVDYVIFYLDSFSTLQPSKKSTYLTDNMVKDMFKDEGCLRIDKLIVFV